MGPRPDLAPPRASQDAALRRGALHRRRRAARRPALRRRRGDLRRRSRRSTAAASSCSATARAPTPRRTSGATSAARIPRASARRCASCDLAEKFGLPVVSFLDTAGASPGHRGRGARAGVGDRRVARQALGAARAGGRASASARAAAAARSRSASATGCIMLENAYYSVISPEMCAQILYRDTGQAEAASSCLRMTAERPRRARHRRRGAARAARRRASRPRGGLRRVVREAVGARRSTSLRRCRPDDARRRVATSGCVRSASSARSTRE